MELRRYGGGMERPSGQERPEGRKPVIIYILVLFAAAFLLMAMSFVAHQRSSEEAMGDLQSSVGAVQEVQELQEQAIALQKELAEAREAAETFQDANETSRERASHAEYTLERTREAMEWFWQLDEAYLKEDLETCASILDTMGENAESPMSEYLSPLAAERYREICAAVDGGEETP